MEIVFISGWATSCRIWDNVRDVGYPVHFLEWNDVLSGTIDLPASCIVVGWSLGGQLALELLKFPEIKGLLLISSMCCIASSETQSRPGVKPSAHSEINSMLTKSRSGYLKSFFRECGANRDNIPLLLNQSTEFSLEELKQGLDFMFKKVVKPTRSLPVMLIHGTRDRIIPLECSSYIADEFFSGSASLLSVEGAGHLLPLTHPDLIIEGVKELAKCLNT